MLQSLLNNRYQILSSLARGGFGETFLAIDTHLPSAKKCVIKQLKPLVETPQLPEWLKERFQKEAAILEELGDSHPQIPKLYAYFSEKGKFYLVQEWIDGMTLTQKWEQKGNFTEGEVKELLVNLLPVLDYIHSRHIIHRDIKPDNIMIRKLDGKPVLIDFGVMKETIGTQYYQGTVSSVILGTPGYMASEQAAGRPVYSSDLYSLGLTAIFLLSGKSPQAFSSDPKTGEILWRSSLNSSHSNLMMVLEKVIRFHPRDRFSSAQEMLAALRDVSLTSPTSATKVITPDSTRSKVPIPKENTGLEIWSWLLMLAVSLSSFALGFLIIALQSRFSGHPVAQPSVLPSSGDFSPRPLFSPTEEPSPTSEPLPRKRRNKPSPEVSISPTPTPSETLSPTPTPSETLDPTPTPSETLDPTPTPSETLDPTPTPSETPSPIIPEKSPEEN